nr:MAG TPA: hypothetical protein [Bacteriophage sp.]
MQFRLLLFPHKRVLHKNTKIKEKRRKKLWQDYQW